jgi:hypothetical protein
MVMIMAVEFTSGICLLMNFLKVAMFNLFHQAGAMKEIGTQLRGNFAWHHGELVVNHPGPGNLATRGNQLRSPLKHETEIP